MKLESHLYQKSFLYFIGFLFLVIAAFWSTYFTQITNQESYRMHVHGFVMAIWCLLLILQPYLIRTSQIKWHHRFGKLSYVIAPLIVITTVGLYKFRLNQETELSTRHYFFTASVLMAVFTFVVFYLLAIYYRKTPSIHARFMVCTVFPFFTAIFDRLLEFYAPSVLPYLPIIDGPVAQVVGLSLGDLILLVLLIWDWFSDGKWKVFLVALVIHLFYHFSVLNFYKYSFWQVFCEWFFRL